MNSTFSQREKTTISLLAALAIICMLHILSPTITVDVIPVIMAFPFAQIGQGMRALSLASRVGNVTAIILYFLFCSLPIVAVMLIRDKQIEDVLLPIMSLVLFITLYYMINPGLLPMFANAVRMEQAVLGGIVYSIIVAYGIMRILRLFYTASAKELGKYISVVLHLVSALFVVYILRLLH